MAADATVVKETKYMASIIAVLSVLMQAVFLILRKWDYTVLLGNFLSAGVSLANFYFMGRSVQKALTMDEADARKVMRASQSGRNLAIFVAAAVGVGVSYFNTIAVIVPLFFPRIAVMLRPLIKDKKDVIDK